MSNASQEASDEEENKTTVHHHRDEELEAPGRHERTKRAGICHEP